MNRFTIIIVLEKAIIDDSMPGGVSLARSILAGIIIIETSSISPN